MIQKSPDRITLTGSRFSGDAGSPAIPQPQPTFARATQDAIMSWGRAYEIVYAFVDADALHHKSDGTELFILIDAFLNPPDAEAAQQLRTPHIYTNENGLPYNPLPAACLALVKKNNKGKIRQDETPKIIHQLSQLYYQRFFSRLNITIERADLLACASLLHDEGEDYGLTLDQLRSYLQEQIKNEPTAIRTQLENDIKLIVTDFDLMSRDIPNNKDQIEIIPYHAATLKSPRTSIAKPFDILHNISTFIGAKTQDKINKKLANIDKLLFTPLYDVPDQTGKYSYFDAARLMHPQHKDIYDMLESTIKAALEAYEIHKKNLQSIMPAAQTGETPQIIDPKSIVPDHLKQTGLPACLEPLRILFDRMDQQCLVVMALHAKPQDNNIQTWINENPDPAPHHLL